MVPANSKRVGVFVGSYLPYSETFIYEQLRSHKRFVPQVFAYETAAGATRFPFSPVHALGGVSRMAYWTLGMSRRFDRVLKHSNPDVLHAHFGTNGSYAASFARRHNVPLVVTFHGHDVPALVGWSRIKPRYSRYALFASRMFKQAKILHACSRDLANRLIRDVGAPASKVEVLHLGVDTDEFVPQVRLAERNVVMIGRFVAKKGHLYGLRAFAQQAQKYSDARLTLIGDGPLRRQYENEIRQLGIQDKVRLTGAIPSRAVRAHLAAANVLLCPSVTAPNGDVESGVIVVKEAAASGLPTIGTRHGGIPEIVVDGETGFLVDECDVAATSRCLGRLFAEPTLALSLGAQARIRAEKYFSLPTQVAKLEELYERAAA